MAQARFERATPRNAQAIFVMQSGGSPSATEPCCTSARSLSADGKKSCLLSVIATYITAFRPHVALGLSYVGLHGPTLVYPSPTYVYPRSHGITRSFISDFSFGQLIEMYKHIALRQMILASGQYNVKKDKDSNNGYTFEFVDSKLTPEDIAALKQIPSRADIDRACETAWNEAATLASQFCKIRIPNLPLTPSDLHPHFRAANGPGRADLLPFGPEEADDDNEASEPARTSKKGDELLAQDTVRFSFTPTPVEEPRDNSPPGSKLSVSQAMEHAAHHIVTEQFLSDEAEKVEAELVAIEEHLEKNPEAVKSISGRMRIADLLNPVEPITPSLPILTFLPADGSLVSRLALVAQRNRHCTATEVHSEKARLPDVDARYLNGNFSLNHAAHQLKEAVQQSEGLRTDTAFQKARYRRWIASGPPGEWQIGVNLRAALTEINVPNVQFRGVTSITPMHIGSWVMMRTARRLYLGKVLGIYRYGSVSSKHESFTDAETVQGLSYLSLEVYEQTGLGRNLFQHVSFAHPSAAGRNGLALFTHAPISELVYLLSGASVTESGAEGLFNLNGGENGWELWNRLCHEEILKVMKVPTEPGVEYVYNQDDYEKPVEGSKKRRAKPPRGAVKKQKVAAEKEKPQRKKKAVFAATVSRKATVKRIRGQEKSGGAKKAKK
ncbi:hypothetical protein B0H16DRAFT_1694558 [Mycena metata]|uniref:Uncharacterized protein n=1 Tax=Mycena metata TaxID=1033252 RepID=A0AAD7MZK9_9AGAR|nr:hypothetical protein B0H16DRAFT_1694558 [Mycena metata]